MQNATQFLPLYTDNWQTYFLRFPAEMALQVMKDGYSLGLPSEINKLDTTLK
jgi:hypothetical protein